jgi:hypothetical protein
MSNPYPWIKDSQYGTTPLVTGYLEVTSTNGLYMVDPTNSSHYTSFGIDTLNVNGKLTNWSTIVNGGTSATNIAGGLAGRIPYQTAINTTAFTETGTTGQFLQSGGTGAPTWVNQNLAATASGLLTNFFANSNQTLTVNFNNSFSSVTRYIHNFTTGSSNTIQTITTYSLSEGLAGGQYTLIIELVSSSGSVGSATWVFNGPSVTGPPPQKSNFTTISTPAMTPGTTRYVVLTFVFDGVNYFISGSNFT